ncbi:MAG: YbjN domain-containing protein [Bacteroidia bacterium]|nr:YbjN domain-containing protein [Bacteroidia bacterium]MDW8134737.1 YbjN domain-containing protein [Bacteroidia bacterium]
MRDRIRKRLEQGIMQFLRKNKLRYVVDEEGDFQVVMGFEELPAQARILFLREGLFGEILTIVARFERLEEPLQEDAALKVANQWNIERRWPRIYWREGQFYGDFHIDLESGFSQRFLELTLHRVIMGIIHFLLHVTKQEDFIYREMQRRFFDNPRLN